jgi:hypothetical protein
MKELLQLMAVQTVFCSVLILLFRKQFKRSLVPLVLLTIALSPIAFISGKYIGAFNANICYSEGIASFSAAARTAVTSENKELKAVFIKGSNEIPVASYGSECSVIGPYLQSFSESVQKLAPAQEARPNKSFKRDVFGCAKSAP